MQQPRRRPAHLRKKNRSKKPKAPRIAPVEQVGTIGEYECIGILGKGGFGVVYKAIDSNTGRVVAIKRVSIAGCSKEEQETYNNEIQLLRELKHQHIVRYVDSITTETDLNIVMEYMEVGQVSSILSKFKGRPPERLVARYTRQILKGLYYLHQQGVIHRDIKGANILSDKDGIIKLADFGVATNLSESGDITEEAIAGSPYWMAPEVIAMKEPASFCCDIWSVGATVIEMLTGKPPFFDLNPMAALYHIVNCDCPPLPESITPHLKEFLLECFQKTTSLRKSALQLLTHPWVLEEEKKNTGEANEGRRKAPESGGKGEEDRGDKEEQDESKSNTQILRDKIQKFAEDDSEDFRDFEDASTLKFKVPSSIQKKSPKSAVLNHQTSSDVDWDAIGTRQPNWKNTIKHPEAKVDPRESVELDQSDSDPFDDITAIWGLDDIKNNIVIEEPISTSFQRATACFSPAYDPPIGNNEESATQFHEGAILSACYELSRLFSKKPFEIRKHMLKWGMMPIIGILHPPFGTNNIIHAALNLFNQLINYKTDEKAEHPDNTKLMGELRESLLMMGMIPEVIRLSRNQYPLHIHIQVSVLTKNLCQKASSKFISAGGLIVLGQFLKSEYTEDCKILVNTAIECICWLFNNTPIVPKNDIARFFAKLHVIPRLVKTLHHIHKELLHIKKMKIDGKRSSIQNTAALNARLFQVTEMNATNIHSSILILKVEVKEKTIQLMKVKRGKTSTKSCKFDQIQVERLKRPGELRITISASPQPIYEKTILFDSERHSDQFCRLVKKKTLARDKGRFHSESGRTNDQMDPRNLLEPSPKSSSRFLPSVLSPEKEQRIEQSEDSKIFEESKNDNGLVEVIDTDRGNTDKGNTHQGNTEKGNPNKANSNKANSNKENDANLEEKEAEYMYKVVIILDQFARADGTVRSHFASREVSNGLILATTDSPSKTVLIILRMLRILCMDPHVLKLVDSKELLSNEAVIVMVKLLKNPSRDIQAEVLKTIFYFTKLNAQRQSQVAMLGILPHLIQIIRKKDHLKEFALPILFRMVKTKDARKIMAASDYAGIHFLTELLSKDTATPTKIDALDALCFGWTQDEFKVSVEQVLQTDENINRICVIFKKIKLPLFERVMRSIYRLINISMIISNLLADKDEFLIELRRKLSDRSTPNNIRISLLRAFTMLILHHQEPGKWITKHKFLTLLADLSKDEEGVIVQRLGADLFDKCSRLVELSEEKKQGLLTRARGRERSMVPQVAMVTSNWQSNVSQFCSGCNRQFGILVRRHHCRQCGALVCAACSENKRELKSSKNTLKHGRSWGTYSGGLQRLCDTCTESFDAEQEKQKLKKGLSRHLKNVMETSSPPKSQSMVNLKSSIKSSSDQRKRVLRRNISHGSGTMR